jgi:transcription antitermination factor NusG
MLKESQTKTAECAFVAPHKDDDPDSRAVACWYATYTRSNHEKRAAVQLEQRAIQHFLPSYATVRKWKDRRKRVELPLFPGYVFVRIPLQERLRVLSIPGVVRLVGFDGRPTALPDAEIETLRMVLARRLSVEPHPYLSVGRKVRISRGALEGMEGVLIRKKGQVRLVVSLDLIRQSAMVEVDSCDVEPISSSAGRGYRTALSLACG